MSFVISEIYLSVSMSLASVSVIATVFVLKLHHCPPHQVKVPNWIRILVLKYLSKVVCCTRFSDEKSNHNQPIVISAASADADDALKRESSEKDAAGVISQQNGTGIISRQNHHTNDIKADDSLNVEFRVTCTNSSDVHVHIYERNGALEDLVMYLRMLVDKTRREVSEVELHDEWQQVALVIDRLMFWMFLIITLMFTMIVLVLIPVRQGEGIGL